MKKYILALALIVTLLVSKDVFAQGKPEGFSLPESAKRVSDNVYYLGKAQDAQSGKEVEGLAIVRRKDNFAKPPWAPGGGGGSFDTSSCYGFLAKGAKWKNDEPWLVNSADSELSSNYVLSNLTSNIAKWEDAAGTPGILGSGSATNSALIADTQSTDGKNEVYFDELSDQGTIGVTIVWGIFGGPPQGRVLVEWDQIYNTYYPWSEDATGSQTDMDFESISTHELGHSVGLDDLYTSGCSDQTMYGYANEGETNKRSLEAGDIKGISELY